MSYNATLIQFKPSTSAVARIRSDNPARIIKRTTANGIQEQLSFAVFSGLPADLRHFTEPFLDEIKRLNKKLWGPSNIENAGRFETICDLALSASPLVKAIESVLDTNYPAVADRTNAEVDNFVMFIIQTLTNQTNAGDTARTALTNQVYGNLVHEESNKLWTPLEFFDRVNEVLDLISKLEHALTDWSEDDKFTAIYNMFPMNGQLRQIDSMDGQLLPTQA